MKKHVSEKTANVLLSIFLFSLALFIICSNVRAYDLQCDIQVTPYQFPAIVTTKYIQVNTTLTNTGKESFPNSTIFIKILTPDQKLLQNYFAYDYSLPDLPVNQSNSYMEPFGSSEYALFQTPITGTWEASLQIIPLPPNTTIHYEHVDNSAGICTKYFSVKEFSQYQTDQINIANQNQTTILTQQLKDLTIDLRNLTIVVILVSIAALSEQLYKFASRHRGLIIFFAGLYGALLYGVFGAQVNSIIIIFGISISATPIMYSLGTVLIISTFLNLFVNGSGNELQLPLSYKQKIVLYFQIGLILVNAIVLLSIALTLFVATQDYLLWFVGIIFSLLALFSTHSYYKEISDYENSRYHQSTPLPM